MAGRRVLVFGGRDWGVAAAGATPQRVAAAELEAMALMVALDRVHRERGIAVVIHGAAPGADSLAGEWARQAGVPEERYRADWATHGRSADPKRNARMLAEGKPDAAVCFPGRDGTLDMFVRLLNADIPIWEPMAKSHYSMREKMEQV